MIGPMMELRLDSTLHGSLTLSLAPHNLNIRRYACTGLVNEVMIAP